MFYHLLLLHSCLATTSNMTSLSHSNGVYQTQLSKHFIILLIISYPSTSTINLIKSIRKYNVSRYCIMNSYAWLFFPLINTQTILFECRKLTFPLHKQIGKGRWAFSSCYCVPQDDDSSDDSGTFTIPGTTVFSAHTTWEDVSEPKDGLLISQDDMDDYCMLPVGLVHTRQTQKARPWDQVARKQARLVYARGFMVNGAINRLEFIAFYHTETGDLIEAADFNYRNRAMAVCAVNDLRRIEYKDQYYDENPDGSTNWETPLDRVLRRVARDYMYTFSPASAQKELGDWYEGRKGWTDGCP